ncbi:MAG TPA: MarR family winged helix-turn-helix transcriptional regulator [Rhizomicrobium sp.]|nr:MarR family winged helix-turn-helix transcriptional regulator [Rhizomicrobium sp.]
MPNDRAVGEKPRLNLDTFLPYRLSVLSNRVSDAIARQYSERFDLSIPEWRIIAVLGQSPNLSAREVAGRTAMDKVQVSRAVTSLVSSRRVTRTEDAEDARISRLTLTAKGRAIYEEVAPLALRLESLLLSSLSPQERTVLQSLIYKLDRQVSLLGAPE